MSRGNPFERTGNKIYSSVSGGLRWAHPKRRWAQNGICRSQWVIIGTVEKNLGNSKMSRGKSWATGGLRWAHPKRRWAQKVICRSQKVTIKKCRNYPGQIENEPGKKIWPFWATIYPSVSSVGGGLNRNAGGLKRKFVDLKKLQLRSVEIILGKSKMSRGNRFEYFALGYLWAHATNLS